MTLRESLVGDARRVHEQIDTQGLERQAERSERTADTAGASGIIDVSRPARAGRAFLQGLVSLAGAASIALLVPFAILMVGLPVALSIRGVLELFGWLFGVSVR